MHTLARTITDVLCGPSPVEALLSRGADELRTLVPELVRTQEIQQRDGTVFQHTLHVLQYLPIRTPVTVWSAIFHDVGKVVQIRLPLGPDRNHADVSAEIADAALRRLLFTDGTREKIVRLVQTHMHDIKSIRGDRDVESFIGRVGVCNLSDWFALRKADCLAYGNGSSLALVNRIQERVEKLLSRADRMPVVPSTASMVTGNGSEAASVQAVMPVQYRPDWDTWYMLIAYLVASRSHDPSTQHGAVFADPNHRPLGWGYNGCPSGCDDHFILGQRPLKYYAVIHAEENGMLYAPRDLTGSTLYVTGMPCSRCWAKIIAKGISRVVYGTIPSRMIDAHDEQARDLLLGPHPEVEVIRWEPQPKAISSLFQAILNKITRGG
jgi:dCMP deaminase